MVITPDSLGTKRLEDELRFFASSETLPILVFPDWETLPYDRFSPYQDIVSDRLATLASLQDIGQGILLVSVQSLMHRLVPPDYIQRNTLLLELGQRLDLQAFRDRLHTGGYRCVSQVLEHGDFAVRGSLCDVFPIGSSVPYRIDLFDDEIDSIRIFDPESQRSIDTVDNIRLLPAHEFPLTPTAVEQFRSRWRSRLTGKPTDCPVYRDMTEGSASAGAHYYLPLFFEQTATLFDYLPPHSWVIVDEGVEAAAETFWDEIIARYEQRRYDPEWPLLDPEAVFLKPQDVLTGVGSNHNVWLGGAAEQAISERYEFATRPPVKIPIDARAKQPLGILKRFLTSFEGRVLIAAESKGRRETLVDLFQLHGLKPSLIADWPEFLSTSVEFGLVVASLQQGAHLERPHIAVISELQLFGERVAQPRRRRISRDTEAIVRDLTELQLGAPVVHEDHGVGRYRGLITLQAGGVVGEFIHIEYADGDSLYVPVSSLHLVSRYSGVDPEHAPLHKLGSGHWQRARAKAAKRIHDVAAELLEIHARRAARKGHSFSVDTDAGQSFVQSFPFEETPDQQVAIDAVLQDMQAEQPMDRLVCGDVGFGKTEVAMRAAFVAVNDGKQVAVLVPTTLLAQQHHENFKDRFADWPVRIEQLSRFLSKKSQDEVIGGLENGSVDIVIGTHKLLQDSIRFKRLGLVIIDEEHRFGVRQKERFKSLRAEVDLLTLTATPIPRSLNMALCGSRELSIMATPPSRRLAVKTFLCEWNDGLMREAVTREIKRGGQVYFLHNEVKTIDKLARKVEALIPEARVRVAHGQMRERELEQVMLDFYHRRFNLLVCTTIIETGIDVPSANTIIIDRAEKFGLAQLYQLRGRVGRSHHRAYAYLLIPSRKAVTADAIRRLEAIESLEELGIGFTLATHDLEIRGAGEILGDEQSGHIQEIGFGLYTELLGRAVAALKAGRQPELDRPLDHGAQIDLHIPVLLPEDYVPDVHTRLIMYKRIASARDAGELGELREEMIDRFGLLPQATKDLFRMTELKLKATNLGIRKVEFGKDSGRIQFDAKPNVDAAAIIELVQTQPQTYRLEKNEKLRISQNMSDTDSRFRVLDELLDELSAKRAA